MNQAAAIYENVSKQRPLSHRRSTYHCGPHKRQDNEDSADEDKGLLCLHLLVKLSLPYLGLVLLCQLRNIL